MLKLGGKVIQIHRNNAENESRLLSISTNPNLPVALRKSKAFLVRDAKIPHEFLEYLILEKDIHLITEEIANKNFTILPNHFEYIGDSDVIRISPRKGEIRVLFRASSNHNSLLVTEQCNHYCLMCSQPPKKIDDSWILKEIEELIPLIPKSTQELGFTGGEPTIYGDRFLKILNLTKSYLPHTSIHILSNGRSFKDIQYAKDYANINHPDMMIGIPIYSDDPSTHDYIVQSKNAFDETIRGILNLKRFNQKVEIRVVIHKQSIGRLIELSEFISRNLLFVDHVALMGLEMMGFTRANLDKLWIDPYEYKDTLSRAVANLSNAGINTSIYNHQLCLINSDVMPYYRKSISDWKNEYASECKNCTRINECGGFFSSGINHAYSKNLTPFS